MNDQELDLLVKVAHEKCYPKDSYIVRKDDAGTSLFLIRSGKVKIVLEKPTGGEVSLSTLGKGSFFGEMSLFDEKPRSATVVAQEDTTIVEIRREAFLQQITKSPEISLKILAEMAGRIRSTDETVKELADKVYREAYTSLEETLNAKLRSAETIYQKTEDRAFKTIDHVESSRKTLMLVAYIIIGVFSTIGGLIGFLGYTKYAHLQKIYIDSIKIGEKIESTEEMIRDTNTLREIMLGIRKVRTDINIDKKIEDMDTETLKMAVIAFRKSKKDLLKYLDVNKEYEPEVRLEAVITFLELIDRGEVKLTTNEKDNILTSLLDILKNSKKENWRMQLKVREMLIALGRSEQFKGRFIWRGLKDIVSKKGINDHVKENVARILASLDKADKTVEEVLMKAMQKGGREFRGNNAAIALIEIGKAPGLKHIPESVESLEKKGFFAAYLLGQFLSEKKPDDLDVSIEDDLVNKVIEQLEKGSTNEDFDEYRKEYVKRVAETLKENWVKDSSKSKE